MIKNDTVPLEWRWPVVLETQNKANKRASTLIRAKKKKSSLLSFTSQSVASSGIFSMDILEHGPCYSLSSFLHLAWIYPNCLQWENKITSVNFYFCLWYISSHFSNLCRQAFLALVSSRFLKYIWMLKVSHFILWNRHLSTVWTAQIKTANSNYQIIRFEKRIVCKSPVCGFASSSSVFAQ